MKHSIISIAVFLLFATACNKNKPKPDNSGLFIKFFGNAYVASGASLTEISDGFVLVGSGSAKDNSNTDLMVIKTDRNGNKVWEQRLGSSWSDGANDVKVDGSDNIHVVGFQEKEGGNIDLSYTLLNSTGSVVKAKTFGQASRNEIGLFINFTNDNAVLMGGLRKYPTYQVMYLLKFAADTVVWEQEVGTIGLEDAIGSVVQLPDSSMLWSGTAKKTTETNMRISKCNKTGDLLWSKEFGELNNNSEYCRDMLLDGNEVLLIGSTGKEKTGSENLYLLKADLNGNFIKDASPTVPQSGGYGVTIADDGGYLIVGYKQVDALNSDMFLVKTDNQGNPLWEEDFGGSRLDYGYGVIATTDGGIAMVGSADVYDGKNGVILFIKADKNGNVNKSKE